MMVLTWILKIIIYLLGVAPNFLPGIGLPALLYVVIPEVSKPNSSLFKNRLYWSVGGESPYWD